MTAAVAAAAVAFSAVAFAPASFAAGPPDPAKWRPVDPEQTLYIDTTKGRVVIEMYPDVAPLAVERIKKLSREKFYDGQIFHRVIANFMAQTGDPQGTGEGGSKLPDLPEEFMFRRSSEMHMAVAAKQPGQTLGFYKTLPIGTQPDEIMQISKDKKAAAWPLHCAGVAAMAREVAPNTANSQFYLMRSTYPSLDKRYTIWGRVIWGQDVVNTLNVGEPPLNPDKMTQVRVAADLPVAERAPLFVMRTDTKQFADVIDDARDKQKADFSVCNVVIPATVQDTPEKGRAWWHKIPFIP
jgi:peptidylprolyl isomerase